MNLRNENYTSDQVVRVAMVIHVFVYTCTLPALTTGIGIYDWPALSFDPGTQL